jgi:CYTH domain-containing protein
VSVSLKYAVIERERRFLLASLPEGAVSTKEIVDRYLTGTRLRLREVREEDGTVVRKLSHKVRLTDGPEEVACTNFYLDEREWNLLVGLSAKMLRKKRHVLHRDGLVVAVDEYGDGTLIAEVDDGERPSVSIPEWLEVVENVSGDESWTGSSLAH